MNLIKKLQKLCRKIFNSNWQQFRQSLAWPQYYVFNFICNNDCNRKLDTAGPKYLLEIKYATYSADFQGTGNQTNTFREVRIKNANWLIIGHLNINSLWNKFKMFEKIITDTFDIFSFSETKLDSSFKSMQNCALCTNSRLCALPINDTRLTRLRASAPLFKRSVETFWFYLINLPAVYSKRLEASGFSCSSI